MDLFSLIRVSLWPQILFCLFYLFVKLFCFLSVSLSFTEILLVLGDFRSDSMSMVGELPGSYMELG